MSSFSFTEEHIRKYAGSKSVNRGAEYASKGLVLSLVRRGNTLEAEVSGNNPEPYHVSVSFTGDKFTAAACDCHYGATYEDWCKHIVAALLAALKNPDEVEERTPASELLAGRSAEELHDLLRTLTEKHPKLADDIEKWARKKRQSKPAKSADSSEPDRATIDARPYQKQMKTIFRNIQMQVENYHSDDDPLDVYVEQVSEIMQEAQEFLDQGAARNAVVILQAITDETADELDELADYSYGEDAIFREIGEMWTEAMLVGQWAPNEKLNWTKQLTEWHGQFEDWGAGQTFKAAVTALEQGWDFPPLVAILSGESEDWQALAGSAEETSGEEEEEEYEEEDYGDEEEDEYEEDTEEDADVSDAALILAKTRIIILHREGRSEEAANLARAAGLHGHYAELLVALNRFGEAAAYAQEQSLSSQEHLTIAKLLVEKGAVAEAIRVGAHGLDAEKRLLDGDAHINIRLAEWLLDYARENSEPEIALRAGVAFVLEAPSLTAWKKLPALAGMDWNNLKTELLADLLAHDSYFGASGKADIFLHEELHAEAVALVRESHDYELMGRVADAALPHVPQDILEMGPRTRRKSDGCRQVVLLRGSGPVAAPRKDGLFEPPCRFGMADVYSGNQRQAPAKTQSNAAHQRFVTG